MIGQEIGLRYHMPMAVQILEREPLAEGHFYPGDLLSSVVRADAWLRSQPALLARVIPITERAVAELGDADAELRSRFVAFLSRVQQP